MRPHNAIGTMAGRPRSFDLDVALDRIVEAFWDQGFAGASVDSLQHCAGVQRGSFYAAFGDKEGAWRRALERYTATVTAAGLATLEEPGDAAYQLAQFIRFVGRFLAANRGRGCMFLSAASQPLPVSRTTRAHLARLERETFAAIRARAPGAAGSYVIAVLLGLNAMARAAMDVSAITAAAETAAASCTAVLASEGPEPARH